MGSWNANLAPTKSPRRSFPLHILLLFLLSRLFTPSLGLVLDVTAHQLLNRCQKSHLEALLSNLIPELEENLPTLISLLLHEAFSFRKHYYLSDEASIINILHWLDEKEAPPNVVSLLLPLTHFQRESTRLSILFRDLLPRWPLYSLATPELDLTRWDSESTERLFVHLRLQQRTRMQSVAFCEQLLKDGRLEERLGTSLLWPLVDLACMRRAQGMAWRVDQLHKWIRTMTILVGPNELLYWRAHTFIHLYFDLIDWRGHLVSPSSREREGGDGDEEGGQEKVLPRGLVISSLFGDMGILSRTPIQIYIDTFFDLTQDSNAFVHALQKILKHFRGSSQQVALIDATIVQFELLTLALQMRPQLVSHLTALGGELMAWYGPSQVPPYICQQFLEHWSPHHVWSFLNDRWRKHFHNQLHQSHELVGGHFPRHLFPRLTQLHLWQSQVLYLARDPDSYEWLSPEAIPYNHLDSYLLRDCANDILTQAVALRPSTLSRPGSPNPNISSDPGQVSSSPMFLLACFENYDDDIVRALQGRLVDLAISGRALPQLPPLLLELLLSRGDRLECANQVSELLEQGRIGEICWIYDNATDRGFYTVVSFLTTLILRLRPLFASLPPSLLQ